MDGHAVQVLLMIRDGRQRVRVSDELAAVLDEADALDVACGHRSGAGPIRVEAEEAAEKAVAGVVAKHCVNAIHLVNGTKRCAACGDVKPLADYYAKATTSDGRDSTCSACRCEQRNAGRKKTEGRK